MTRYEWAARHKRTGEIHRHFDEDEDAARRWFDAEDWDGLDVHKLFELVRRPVADWEPVPVDEDA